MNTKHWTVIVQDEHSIPIARSQRIDDISEADKLAIQLARCAFANTTVTRCILLNEDGNATAAYDCHYNWVRRSAITEKRRHMLSPLAMFLLSFNAGWIASVLTIFLLHLGRF